MTNSSTNSSFYKMYTNFIQKAVSTLSKSSPSVSVLIISAHWAPHSEFPPLLIRKATDDLPMLEQSRNVAPLLEI